MISRWVCGSGDPEASFPHGLGQTSQQTTAPHPSFTCTYPGRRTASRLWRYPLPLPRSNPMGQIQPRCYRAGQGVVHDKVLQKGFPLSVSGGSFPHTHLLGSKHPPPEERRLSMPETGEKERNCLFKSYTDLE